MGSKISSKELISDLRKVGRVLGVNSFSMTLYRKHGHYSTNTHRRCFGSWNKALEHAGLAAMQQMKISDEQAIQDLQRVAAEMAKDTLTHEQYDEIGVYSSGFIARRFGGWNIALLAAGLKKSKEHGIQKHALLQDLQAVAKTLEQDTVSISQYDKHGTYGSAVIVRRWGWNMALREAGLTLQKRIPDESVLQDIRNVAEVLGKKSVWFEEYKQHGAYSTSVAIARFGSWNQALHRAGLEISRGTLALVSIDGFFPYADTLSYVLRSLRLERNDLTSDALWQTIKQRWTERDLVSAIELFQTTEDLSAFRTLLSR